MLIRENVPLAPLTTLGVGGPARFFAEAGSADDVRRAVHHARERGLPLFVLGGGSNLVVSDSGWPGLVLRIRISGIEEREEEGKVIFEARAPVTGIILHICAVPSMKKGDNIANIGVIAPKAP